MAHKKGLGSTRNGRDSRAQRLGVKKFGGVLYLLDRNGLRRTMTAENGLCYYSARLNGSDYLAVTEQKGGFVS